MKSLDIKDINERTLSLQRGADGYTSINDNFKISSTGSHLDITYTPDDKKAPQLTIKSVMGPSFSIKNDGFVGTYFINDQGVNSFHFNSDIHIDCDDDDSGYLYSNGVSTKKLIVNDMATGTVKTQTLSVGILSGDGEYLMDMLTIGAHRTASHDSCITSKGDLYLNNNCKLSVDGKTLTVEKVTGIASKAESLINSTGADYSFTESQPIAFVDGKPTAINEIQITGDVTCNEVSVKSIKIGNHVLDENKLIKLLDFLETLEIEN